MREITRVDGHETIKVTIKDATDVFTLTACKNESNGLWDVFGHWQGEEDSDSVGGYRADDQLREEVELFVKDFITEYGNPKG